MLVKTNNYEFGPMLATHVGSVSPPGASCSRYKTIRGPITVTGCVKKKSSI